MSFTSLLIIISLLVIIILIANRIPQSPDHNEKSGTPQQQQSSQDFYLPVNPWGTSVGAEYLINNIVPIPSSNQPNTYTYENISQYSQYTSVLQEPLTQKPNLEKLFIDFQNGFCHLSDVTQEIGGEKCVDPDQINASYVREECLANKGNLTECLTTTGEKIPQGNTYSYNKENVTRKCPSQLSSLSFNYDPDNIDNTVCLGVSTITIPEGTTNSDIDFLLELGVIRTSSSVTNDGSWPVTFINTQCNTLDPTQKMKIIRYSYNGGVSTDVTWEIDPNGYYCQIYLRAVNRYLSVNTEDGNTNFELIKNNPDDMSQTIKWFLLPELDLTTGVTSVMRCTYMSLLSYVPGDIDIFGGFFGLAEGEGFNGPNLYSIPYTAGFGAAVLGTGAEIVGAPYAKMITNCEDYNNGKTDKVNRWFTPCVTKIVEEGAKVIPTTIKQKYISNYNGQCTVDNEVSSYPPYVLQCVKSGYLLPEFINYSPDYDSIPYSSPFKLKSSGPNLNIDTTPVADGTAEWSKLPAFIDSVGFPPEYFQKTTNQVSGVTVTTTPVGFAPPKPLTPNNTNCVRTIKISSSSTSNVRRTGPWRGLSSSSTGSGTGATFNVQISSTPVAGETLVETVEVFNQGKGYSVGDTITILGSEMGSTITGEGNLVLTVTAIFNSESFLVSTSQPGVGGLIVSCSVASDGTIPGQTIKIVNGGYGWVNPAAILLDQIIPSPGGAVPGGGVYVNVTVKANSSYSFSEPAPHSLFANGNGIIGTVNEDLISELSGLGSTGSTNTLEFNLMTGSPNNFSSSPQQLAYFGEIDPTTGLTFAQSMAPELGTKINAAIIKSAFLLEGGRDPSTDPYTALQNIKTLQYLSQNYNNDGLNEDVSYDEKLVLGKFIPYMQFDKVYKRIAGVTINPITKNIDNVSDGEIPYGNTGELIVNQNYFQPIPYGTENLYEPFNTPILPKI